LNVGQLVTFREWAVEGKYAYSWTIPSKMQCLDLVGEPYTGTYYQQIVLKAKTPDCKLSTSFKKLDETSSLNFNFIVWATRVPPVEGKLVELDTLDWDMTPAQFFEMQKNELITFRANEKPEGGFAWEAPAGKFVCVELVTTNLGNFNTKYAQWVFKALDMDRDCTQDVPLKRPGEEKSSFTVVMQVKQGHCAAPTPPCEKGFIQNLALTSCKCEAL